MNFIYSYGKKIDFLREKNRFLSGIHIPLRKGIAIPWE
jgi:hypothetical protein